VEKSGNNIAVEASVIFSDGYTGLHGREEYNDAIAHIYDLICASYTLLKSGSFAPSLFLSITIFEEIAKIKAGYMRAAQQKDLLKVKRGKDHLFNHNMKHKIAISPVYLIGDRIANSIGADRAKEIFEGYSSGEYSSLREKSLYFARDNESLHIPSKYIDSNLAAEHLLIAIEIFVDEFWGMTISVSTICDKANEFYIKVESILKNMQQTD
jgi:AbiV family abortive infection protein